jgi:tRNA(adenine34) deaminase
MPDRAKHAGEAVEAATRRRRAYAWQDDVGRARLLVPSQRRSKRDSGFDRFVCGAPSVGAPALAAVLGHGGPAIDPLAGPPHRAGMKAAGYMDLALDEARAAAARGEVPVGAVLVDAATGEVIARAGNRTEADGDPTAHAEMLVIREAAAARGAARLPDCDLYVTLEPCAMCAAAIAFARLRRLYWGAPDPKGGAVEHGPRFFDQPTCHHRPELYGGIAEAAAGALLKAFFAARR